LYSGVVVFVLLLQEQVEIERHQVERLHYTQHRPHAVPLLPHVSSVIVVHVEVSFDRQNRLPDGRFTRAMFHRATQHVHVFLDHSTADLVHYWFASIGCYDYITQQA